MKNWKKKIIKINHILIIIRAWIHITSFIFIYLLTEMNSSMYKYRREKYGL